MKVRVGIAPSPRYGEALRLVGAAALVSANSLWRPDGKFRVLKRDAFGGHADVALDSSGFVAMMLYGGYRWTVDQYVALAASRPWAWWASMDFCCEPEIAKDREEVARRISMTVEHLRLCRDAAERHGAAAPMPVLQGRAPDDYERCAAAIGNLPALVGLGSVCRRNLQGDDGIAAVLSRLDSRLPPHVRLHLFGVKGSAIEALVGHPRVASVDSMAWDYQCRRQTQTPRTVDKRIEFMTRWWEKQVEARSLFGSAT